MYLMHKDIYVARVEQKLGRLSITEIFNKNHLPVGTRNPAVGTIDRWFNIWYSERAIPSTRPNLKQFLEAAGVNDLAELTTVSPMCSLTDCYWFKPDYDIGIHWDDVNFFKNGFESNISQILIDGTNVEINNFNTPDLMTNGALPKRWIQGDDKRFYLVKGALNSTREAVYNEVFASRLALLIGLPAIPYYIWTDPATKIPYSVCPSFIQDDDSELVTLHQYAHEFGRTRANEYRYVCTHGWKEGTDKYLLLDTLTGNCDRHDGNIGEIRDPDTLKSKYMSPIFDNGECMPYDRINHRNIKPISKLFNDDPEDEARLIGDFSPVTDTHLCEADIRDLVEDVYGDCYNAEERNDLVGAVAERLDFVIELAAGIEESIDYGEEI